MNAASFLAADANRRAERMAPTQGTAQREKPGETAAATERSWKGTSRPQGTEKP
jgi:hypothetical protein